MSDETDAFQTILTDVDELLREKFRDLGFPDTPFVLVAVSQKNELVIRENMSPSRTEGAGGRSRRGGRRGRQVACQRRPGSLIGQPPAGVGQADAVPALDQQPAAIDRELNGLLRLAGIRDTGDRTPLQRPPASRVVERPHDLQSQALRVGRHGNTQSTQLSSKTVDVLLETPPLVGAFLSARSLRRNEIGIPRLQVKIGNILSDRFY